MLTSSRRAFVKGSAVVPFADWLYMYGQPPTVTRSEATTAAGRAMLVRYRTTVQQMMSAPEREPTGWLFQWYTHAVRNGNKAAEIARIYPSASPQRQLAQDTWDTCHSHFPNMDENFFLPWHRVFVLMFERIIRRRSGDPNFALPYWNYSVTGAAHGVLPPEFRASGSSLFRSNRNAAANQGRAIDQTRPGALSLDSLRETSYGPSGPRSGFNMGLDFGLHGNVHVLVGNSTNMGNVPTAAGDPIFWLHHCNVDRLWASWNRNGGRNPTDNAFLNKTFTFSDENGVRVTSRVRDFLDIATLRYTYDRLEPRPAGAGASDPATTSSAPAATVASARQITLTAQPVRVAVQGSGAAASATVKLAADKATLVVIRNLQTDVQPEVVYDVFMDPPAGASGAALDQHLVGSINFFHAGGHAGHSGGGDRFYTLDATATVRRLQASGRLSRTPAIVIVPRGQPAGNAKPVIGEITIVQQ